MRISVILLLSLLSFKSTGAVDDKSMKDLFAKYDALMDNKKVELIDEVFTQKFIKESGGKKELIQKIKELKTSPNKLNARTEMTWQKGVRGKNWFAKIKEKSSDKSKKETEESQFIIIEENGKPKINGTLSDPN